MGEGDGVPLGLREIDGDGEAVTVEEGEALGVADGEEEGVELGEDDAL